MPEVSGSHVKADCQTCSVVLVLQVSESLRTVLTDFQAILTVQKLNPENHWSLAWAFTRREG